ncbi:MAG: hypothetical protein ACFFAU_21025, partial [Candidatus Hodarchaeota archaeon]
YSTSVRQLIEITYEKTNTHLPDDIFNQSPQSNEIIDFWADISKIKHEIGWEPKVSITAGIQKMIDYYLLDEKK